MRDLKVFALGSIAIGVLAYALVAALAVAAQAGGRTVDVAVGPLDLVSVTRVGQSTVTTFGPGLVLLALAGGCANLAAAHLLRRRASGSDVRVE